MAVRLDHDAFRAVISGPLSIAATLYAASAPPSWPRSQTVMVAFNAGRTGGSEGNGQSGDAVARLPFALVVPHCLRQASRGACYRKLLYGSAGGAREQSGRGPPDNMLGALRADPEAPIHIEALRQAAPGGLAAGIWREFPPAPHNGRALFAEATRALLRESRSENAVKLSLPKTCS